MEKVTSLEEFGRLLSFNVDGYYASEGIMPPPPGNGVCVATIEKANSILNALIEADRLAELGCIVVDEIRILFFKFFNCCIFLLNFFKRFSLEYRLFYDFSSFLHVYFWNSDFLVRN
jgi:hypothetical protein